MKDVLEKQARTGTTKLLDNLTPVTLPVKKSKYRNVKETVDGIIFDSKKEANRYRVLRQLQHLRLITDLRWQVRFNLDVNGHKICYYVADFVYKDVDNVTIVEDVKSDITRKNRAYRIKLKLMKAIHGIDIREL